ncbi:MFS general substrate transporter [Ramicandelaber brevisporus]|nr:MFS general substrate transporter [Ramicandelaber brevisporus]
MTSSVDKPYETVPVLDDKTTVGLPSETGEKSPSLAETAPEPSPAAPAIVPPDGGYGWVVVASCFFCIFAAYGFLNSFGVYAEYYKNTAYTTTPSAVITLIGVLQVAFLNLTAPVAGWLADHLHFNVVIAVGGVIMCLGMVIASFATHIWMLLVFQGAMVGIGASLVVTLSITVPAQWFTSKRGLASGIVFSGSGFGGVAFSPIIRKLMTTVGFGWTARISGIIVGVLIVIASIGIRRLFPPAPRAKLFDISRFKDIKMIMFALYSILMFGVFFIPYYYLPIFTTRHGYSASVGSMLALLTNLGTAVGRIFSGFVSDRIGNFNTLLLSILIALVSTLVLWLPFTSVGTAAAYAVIYGIASGGQITMLGVTVAQVFGIERLASYFGMIMFLGAAGVLPGTPSAGQLLDSLGHGSNFTPLIIYLAIVLALQLVPVTYLRAGFSRRPFVKF